MSKRLLRLTLALYLLAIYSTLGYVRAITNYLRDHGLLRAAVAVAFTLAGSALVVLIVRDRRNRSLRVMTTLLVTGAVYAAVILPMKSPEEKIHFIEYGVAALLADAASPATWSSRKRFLLCALFVAAAGWLDEGIQAILPNRYYDLRDVAFNAAAGLLALAALAAIRAAATTRETTARPA